MKTTAEIAELFIRGFKVASNDVLCVETDFEHRDLLLAMIYEADDQVGRDFAYEATRDVLQVIRDVDPKELSDIIDGDEVQSLVDIYTADLTQWLASDLSHVGLCDEASEEYGAAYDGTLEDVIRRGQYRAYELVAQAVISNWPTTCDECGEILQDAGDGYDSFCADCADHADYAAE